MSLFLRDQEKIEEGEERGREEKMRAMVKNMLRENDPIDKICRIAECDEAYVKEIQEELETEDITSPSTTVTSISRNQGLTISDIINIILITIGILLIFLAITILIKLK